MVNTMYRCGTGASTSFGCIPISAGYVQRACELARAAKVSVEILGTPPRVEMVIRW